MNFIKKLLEFCNFDRRKKHKVFHSIFQFEQEAEKILPLNIYNFFAGGAGEELSLKENIASFDKLKLIPRVLKEIDSCNLSTQLLGQDIDFPVLVAPMAFQNLVHRQGEIAVAKAASSHGTIMTVSTLSTSSLKDIKKVSSLSPWFQVYIYKDREITKNLIKQADALNYGAIVLTVDAPFYAKRVRELENPISLESHSQIINLVEAGLKLDKINPSLLPQYLSSLLESNIGWKNIEWIRSLTSLPIILKGILHPDDIQIAIDHKVQGVVLSNHGGRQLDTGITALESLSLIKENTKNEIDILIDGGIRKGIDILKALALGAKAVMVGRPIIWGLTVNGEEGVYQVLDILKKELCIGMALTGITSVMSLDKGIIKI